jgi:molecular chaperone GrpE
MAESEKEYEIPLKVVDRRRFVNHDAAGNSTASAEPASLKPTYVEELEQKVAQKEREAQEYIAKYRQANAEFESARARLRKEISKDIERARRETLSEMLEILDNLDRAIESSRGSSSVDALLQGVEMVRRQFLSKLEGLGVRRIDAEGQRFDPALHEAITTVPAAAPDQDGLIVGVIRHGYRIGDEVLRPASVAVAQQA